MTHTNDNKKPMENRLKAAAGIAGAVAGAAVGAAAVAALSDKKTREKVGKTLKEVGNQAKLTIQSLQDKTTDLKKEMKPMK